MANVFTIPASAPFAETLARGLIAKLDPDQKDAMALSAATIYLPTRRAVRDFPEVFARIMGGAALLPQMHALGDVDEDELLLAPDADDLSLLPAIAPMRRQLLLARLVRKANSDLTFAQAASLAASLAQFLDEAQTQRIDLATIKSVLPERFAQHWQRVWAFLDILRELWPLELEREGALDPADRRNRSLAALAAHLAKHPPAGPVVAAGSTGSIPATADLLRIIAILPNGYVVLPGLDRELDNDSWNDLDPGHPQYGMKKLLGEMHVQRKDVRDWEPRPANNPAREKVLREVLRPAPTTDAWRAIAEKGDAQIAQGLEGISLVEAANPGEEATTIALILREALEQKDKTAALVTPDRNLARRVSAEMRRWNIEIDDSAGRPLANTPPGTFLCLLAEAADQNFAPVPLLALLKHPLASGGEETSEFRGKVRELDRLALRGLRPDPGLDGILKAITAAENEARERAGKASGEKERERARRSVERFAGMKAWFESVAGILRPLEVQMSSDAAIAEAADCHGRIAEKLAKSDTETGASRLWSKEDGNRAAEFIAALKLAAAGIEPVEASSYPVLFRALAEGPKVRSAVGRHPRLSILGQLEARLQSFDTVVLGGLNEGAWPKGAPVDPWLSRQMRTDLGLEQPERDIGLSAHDFVTLASGPRVILTRAQKSEGSPAIESRWLQRLRQLTRGLGIEDKLTTDKPYVAWARMLDMPPGKPEPEKRPAPTPPVNVRPRSLSVTEIEKWLRDPYWVYAKHILKLAPLDPLDDEVGPLERGNTIHEALERFTIAYPEALPADAADRLVAIADEVFARAGIPHAALALWRPRFINAARWFVGEERERREQIARSFVEKKGTRKFAGPGGEFELRCRADRIDILKTGGASIVDYKTGAAPSKEQVKTLLSPQLPLEGVILRDPKGFAEIGAQAAEELLYIKFSGGKKAGDTVEIPDVPALVEEAERRLIARIADFDNPKKPYHAQVMPVSSREHSDYGHLERVREWLDGGWSDE